jgi:hypothetical protein
LIKGIVWLRGQKRKGEKRKGNAFTTAPLRLCGLKRAKRIKEKRRKKGAFPKRSEQVGLNKVADIFR